MGQEKIIKNRQFGDITVDLTKTVTFPDGVIGFEDLREYILIDFEEYEPFQWLIAIDDPEVVFPIVSPIVVKKDYEPPIARESLNKIGDFKDEDLLIYSIITIKPKGEKITANLKGPIVINQKNPVGATNRFGIG